MAGTSRLLVIVEVAFGAGALDTGTLTWTDISSHVKLSRGIECSRGVDTETGGPMPGRLTFAVNNDGGDFTPGKTGAFGLIRNRLPVRVRTVVGSGTGIPLAYDSPFAFDFDTGYDDVEVGSVVVWTGLVETWKIGWTAGVRPQVDVTCVDRWAALRRLKIDEDRIGQIAASTQADIFYPCTEPALPLREYAGRTPEMTAGWLTFVTPAPVAAAVNHPTTTTKSVPQWSGNASGTSVYMSSGMWSDTFSLDGGVSATVFLKPSATYSAYHSVTFDFGPNLNIRTGGMFVSMSVGLTYSSGALRASGSVSDGANSASASGGAVTDFSRWHAVTLTATRSGGVVSVALYMDGVQVGTGSNTVSNWTAASTYQVRFGGEGSGADTSYTLAFAGVMVHRRALSGAEALAVTRQVSPWGGDTAAQRADTLKQFGPIAASATGTFTATMSTQDLAGKSLADALAECATAEAGQLFIGTDGWPTLTSRAWRTAAALAFTIPAHALSTDTSWTLDDQQLVNSATVDRMVGDQTAATVTARNDDSVATYGEQTTAVSLFVDTDAQLLERANAEANMFATATPRSSDLTVDLITKAATISPATLLAADVGSRIAVSGMPTEAPTQTQFYVAAIADKITHTGWERTFTVSPRLDWWTLQDATSGQLDSTFVLAF